MGRSCGAEMDENGARAALARLIADRGENFGALSRLLGRNAAYIQQYIRRGTPRKLDEQDRRVLARYFGVDEALLGAPAPDRTPEAHPIGPIKRRSSKAIASIPRLRLEVSAGVGMVPGDERAKGAIGFDERWLHSLGLLPENLSIIDVNGESMAPTLNHGDNIMVDRSDAAGRLRDGIYVLRLDDALMVKRIALSPGRGSRELTISSDNAHYPRWAGVDPALVDIVGRVVWVCRTLA